MARFFTTAGSRSIARLAAGSTLARAPISSTADCSAEICSVSCAVARR
jgi:hypothetical protein